MARDTFDCPWLLQAPSSLALKTSWDGAATASLCNLCQGLTTLGGKNFFLISDLNLLSVSLEPFSLVLSLELFVQYLATYSYKHGRGKEKNALTYTDLSHTAEECETFQFLADILPKKILASKYLKMLEKEKRDGEVREDDDEAEEEEDEDEAVGDSVGS